VLVTFYGFGTLSGERKATMESTVYSVRDGSLPLNNFQDISVTEILISPMSDKKPTNWVVHGKAVLANQDGDAQNASAWLALKNGDEVTAVIDRADVRIDQYGNTVSICLLGVVQAKLVGQQDCEVELHCSTYRGHVVYTKLAAMSTDSATEQPIHQ
jgi:hypothetical protein